MKGWLFADMTLDVSTVNSLSGKWRAAYLWNSLAALVTESKLAKLSSRKIASLFVSDFNYRHRIAK